MTLEEKVQSLERKKGMNHPVPVFRALLNKYLPEHTSLPLIQVAGTNGKGSTVKWISLLADRNKVGTFTSPHLISHFERIQINGKNIPAADWERIYDAWNWLFEKENFTMFEADLWMAVVWFLEQQADLAVMEVGLGGEKDATTALDYLAKGITNIGMDHMALLGNTKEEIARTKGGIFRPGVPAVTTEKEMFPILQQMDPDLVPVVIPDDVLSGLPAYQTANLALAEALLSAADIPMRSESAAVSAFSWKGRWTIVRTDPLLIVDGAHNLDGIEAIVREHPPVDRIYFSVLADKQGTRMISLLQSLQHPVILVHFDSARLADLESFGLPVISLEQMLCDLHEKKAPAALVCGSLYFVGEVLQRWES